MGGSGGAGGAAGGASGAAGGASGAAGAAGGASGAAAGGSGAQGEAAGGSGAGGAAGGKAGASGSQGEGASGAGGKAGASGAQGEEGGKSGAGASGGDSASEEAAEKEAEAAQAEQAGKWKILRKRITKLKGRISKIEEDFFQMKNGGDGGAEEEAMESAKAALGKAGSAKDIDAVEAKLTKAVSASPAGVSDEKHEELVARVKSLEDKIAAGTSKGESPPRTYTAEKPTGTNTKVALGENSEDAAAKKADDDAAPKDEASKPEPDAQEVGAEAAAEAKKDKAAAPAQKAASPAAAGAPAALLARIAKLEKSVSKAAFLEIYGKKKSDDKKKKHPCAHSDAFLEMRDRVFDLESQFIEKLMPGKKVMTSKTALAGKAEEPEQSADDVEKDKDLLDRATKLESYLHSKLRGN